MSYQDRLLSFIDDPKTSMRALVAHFIEPIDHLTRMIGDDRAEVRIEVARRIEPKHLTAMVNDSYWTVRFEVARRIEHQHLVPMLFNSRNWKHKELMLMILSRLPIEEVPPKWVKLHNELTVSGVMNA